MHIQNDTKRRKMGEIAEVELDRPHSDQEFLEYFSFQTVVAIFVPRVENPLAFHIH